MGGLPGQLSYFVAGDFLYYFLPLFEKHVHTFLMSAIAALLINTAVPLMAPAATDVVVTFCALFCYLGDFGKYGDFSYGMYILHFPIIQTLRSGGWFTDSPYTFLGAVIGLAGLGAVLMCHLVESQFLRRTAIPQHSRQPPPADGRRVGSACTEPSGDRVQAELMQELIS